MADKRVLLDRASLATLGTRAHAIRLSFAAQDQAVAPGRAKRFFQMLWSYLGLVEDLGIMPGSGTGDATRLDDLAKAAGAFRWRPASRGRRRRHRSCAARTSENSEAAPATTSVTGRSAA